MCLSPARQWVTSFFSVVRVNESCLSLLWSTSLSHVSFSSTSMSHVSLSSTSMSHVFLFFEARQWVMSLSLPRQWVMSLSLPRQWVMSLSLRQWVFTRRVRRESHQGVFTRKVKWLTWPIDHLCLRIEWGRWVKSISVCTSSNLDESIRV